MRLKPGFLILLAAKVAVGFLANSAGFGAELSTASTDTAVADSFDQIVVVAHKDKRSIREIAANVTVLSRAELNDNLATSISDVFRYVPGGRSNGGDLLATWSGKEQESTIVIVDDKTRELKSVIKGPEIVTPTGKFDVFNTLNDIY